MGEEYKLKISSLVGIYSRNLLVQVKRHDVYRMKDPCKRRSTGPVSSVER